MKELNKQTSDQRVTTENNAGDPSVTAKTPRQPTNTGGRNTSVNTLPSGPKMAANFATFEQRQSMKFLRSARRHKGQEMLLKQKLKEKKRIFSNIQPHSSSPLSTAHILQVCLPPPNFCWGTAPFRFPIDIVGSSLSAQRKIQFHLGS